jgi:hypothetical protein
LESEEPHGYLQLEEAETLKRIVSAFVTLMGVAVLASCTYLPSWFPQNHSNLAANQMTEIVDAINQQDAATLKGTFTDYALGEHDEEVDEGVTYLLSVFPNGDLVWENPDKRVGRVSESYNAGKRTINVHALYRVSSGGKAYWLYFSFFTVNEQDPENLGVYAIGAAPRTETLTPGLRLGLSSGPEGMFFRWTGSVSGTDPTADPGGYIPDYEYADLSDLMVKDLIDDDLNTQDHSGLRDKFTEHAQVQFPDALVDEVDALFALFPEGGIVWEPLQEQPEARVTVDGDEETILLLPIYRITAGGEEYWFFFADYTVNTIDPQNLGIYGIGVAPHTATGDSPAEQALFEWADSFQIDTDVPPKVVIFT